MIALITGITGQDGSYLAEFLLDKGYEVHGVVRRSSLEKFDRIAHLKGRIALHQGDLLDQLSLLRVVEKVRPDELYNLAAQSFVPTSWEQPLLTGEFTALGVTRVLEAIRQVDPGIRFYQASSSEMFGKVRQTPQNEATPFYPRSPYGVAKVYGHFITVNYRESYDLFAVSGILFNHECVTAETPVIVRRDGLLRILPIEDLVPHRSDPASGTKHTGAPTRPLEVWDRGGWTRVTQMTATWNDASRPEHKPVRTIAARGALFSATHGHVAFREGGEEVRIEQITEGDRLELIDLPPATNAISMTEDEAWLLGALVAEGHIGDRRGRFTSSDPDLVDRVAEAWCRVTGGRTSRGMGVSGFEGGAPAVQSNLAGAPDFLPWVRAQIYTRSGYKRVPVRVLNGDEAARRAFLSGYNEGDGLRAGHGDSEFKSFETSSAALAQGLWWLVSETLGHRTILCTEERDGRRYYRVSLNSPANPVGEDTGKGIHLRRPRAEVVEADDGGEAGWVFDLATESGTFQAGIGRGWIHNSPRRGLEFVTRKVSWNAAGIARGLADRLPMGNLEARRDWGFAGDYVVAMWKMLQQDQPEDFVIGTGTTHSVRDLLEVAFDEVGLDWRDYVEEDPAFLRPAEVEQLCADATRAKEKLGWAPSVTFQELVRMMVRADLDRIDRGAAASEGP